MGTPEGIAGFCARRMKECQEGIGKDRWVPLHPSAAKVLRAYVKRRIANPFSRSSDAFFIDDRGRALRAGNVRYIRLRRALRRARSGRLAPRIHDLCQNAESGKMPSGRA